MDIVERLRFDAARCEMQFSKGVATNIEEAIAEIERLRARLPESPEPSSVEREVGVPEGWMLVPIEPTEEMLYAARHESEIVSLTDEENAEIWQAFLSAIPAIAQPKPTKGGEVSKEQIARFLQCFDVLGRFEAQSQFTRGYGAFDPKEWPNKPDLAVVAVHRWLTELAALPAPPTKGGDNTTQPPAQNEPAVVKYEEGPKS